METSLILTWFTLYSWLGKIQLGQVKLLYKIFHSEIVSTCIFLFGFNSYHLVTNFDIEDKNVNIKIIDDKPMVTINLTVGMRDINVFIVINIRLMIPVFYHHHGI